MKRKSIIKSMIIASSIILITAGLIGISFAGKSIFPYISPEKQDFDSHRNAIMNENIKKALSNSAVAKLDDQTVKDLANDMPSTSEEAIGIIKHITEPDLAVPLPHTILEQYNFDTVGYSPYNRVVTGRCADNIKDGIIINFYIRPKTGENSKYFYRITGVGDITLTSINNDNEVFTFKTASGKTGTFDVADGKGKYTIN